MIGREWLRHKQKTRIARNGAGYEGLRCGLIRGFGLPGGTRTPDLLLRRQLLYPVELRAGEYGKMKIGRSEGIRTPDPLVPNQMRYQAALRSEPGHSNEALRRGGRNGNPDREAGNTAQTRRGDAHRHG